MPVLIYPGDACLTVRVLRISSLQCVLNRETDRSETIKDASLRTIRREGESNKRNQQARLVESSFQRLRDA